MVQRRGRLHEARSFLSALYGADPHAKRMDAFAGATLGVIAATALAMTMISQARGLVTRHAVKQVDRLLNSNTSKTRTHVLFRQGCMLDDLIPTCQSAGWHR